jgi:tetraacyldisaccharide 4'-kinase
MNARRLLMPLTPLYAAGVALRNHLHDLHRHPLEKLRWPVISIGSVSAGGAGKTPLTLLLADALERHGWQPDVLTRGYGRAAGLCEQVDPSGSSLHFGDEPMLMAQAGLSVFVAAIRYQAGGLAERVLPAQPRPVHLLDDGFQHRRLHRDIDIALLTAVDWRDALLPAGNLREPLSSLLRADAIVLREEEAAIGPPLRALFARSRRSPSILRIRRALLLQDAPTRPLIFSGIARPGSFHAMLRNAGHDATRTVSFRDHQAYTPAVLESLVAAAKRVGANGFIATEKDAVKLTAPMRTVLQAVGPLAIAKLKTEFCDEPLAMQWLLEKLVAATGGAV